MAPENLSRAPADVLRAARQRDSQAKRGRVLLAVQDMLKDNQRITFAEVARKAQVSSWLVYAPGVREHIETARDRQTTQPHRDQQRGLKANPASEQTDLLLAREEIRRLRAERTSLQDQARRHLGEKLEHLGHQDLIQRVNELSEVNQRLATAERQTATENEQLQARVSELEDDLTATRTSLRRMIRNENRA
ncbi:DUF6262 family protein [Streptomyces phaeochromogenes]|uniref:DUF6262 family protein n=1 Tax=Streptomyces phaeochromogenes TaxID=1923 RepID=UPI00386AEE91|nr:DUF6262 family protein [Streptomyces phaeochromogenes]WSS99046.1 DUF6262 family protein [Streptomyces phaeochromogenes]